MEEADFIIIGAGVVGLAISAALAQKYHDKTIVLIEKNDKFGRETSSRNSEVIHSGIYYPANSLKTALCVEGNRLLYRFCAENQIPHQKIGKLIVARDSNEIPSLKSLMEQGLKNKVAEIKYLEKFEVLELEPNINAVAAIFLPTTGIVDSHRLMAKLENTNKQKGVFIVYQNKVVKIQREDDGYIVTCSDKQNNGELIKCRWLINCAGLEADKIAALAGIDIDKHGYRIFPCKGEYFSLSQSPDHPIHHLVYPPPHKDLKGLGVHVTKSLDGRLRLGPNAFYMNEPNYDVDPEHAEQFYESVKGYLPWVKPHDISPDMAGIRPKLQAEGMPFRDFMIRHEADKGLHGLINLVGIESPGLTSCLSIAKMVCGMVDEV